MPEWLSVSRLVDIILLGMAVEAYWLFGRHRRLGLPGMPTIFFHLLSGAFLLIAMKLILANADELHIMAALGISGVAHATDIVKEMSRSAVR